MDKLNYNKQSMEVAFEKAVQELTFSYGNFELFDRVLANPSSAKLIIQNADFKLLAKSIFFYFLGTGFIFLGLLTSDQLFRAVTLLIGIAVLSSTFVVSRRFQGAIGALSAVTRDYGKTL